MSTTSPAANPAAKPEPEELNVITILKQLREGEFISEFDDAMKHVHQRVGEHGKPGTLTIKFTLTPSGRTITIEDEVSGKAPKEPKSGTIFFSDKGELTRKDPKQIDFAQVDPSFRGRRTINE